MGALIRVIGWVAVGMGVQKLMETEEVQAVKDAFLKGLKQGSRQPDNDGE